MHARAINRHPPCTREGWWCCFHLSLNACLVCPMYHLHEGDLIAYIVPVFAGQRVSSRSPRVSGFLPCESHSRRRLASVTDSSLFFISGLYESILRTLAPTIPIPSNATSTMVTDACLCVGAGSPRKDAGRVADQGPRPLARVRQHHPCRVCIVVRRPRRAPHRGQAVSKTML